MQNSIVYQQSTETGLRDGLFERTHGSVFALKDYASYQPRSQDFFRWLHISNNFRELRGIHM